MTDFDLLDTVLAPEGWYAVVGVKNKTNAKQKLVQTREEVNEVARQYVQQGRDVYFGCAKFATGDNREQDNATYFKALWIDIDCGEDKVAKNEGYVDQATGLQELQRFCRDTKLPKPILVDSGRGIHAYWAFTTVVDKETWQPMSDRLKELCQKHALISDSRCFEPARVLRIPGTFNFKEDEPLEVSVISVSEPYDHRKLRLLLGEPEKKFVPRRNVQRSALTMSLMKNRTSKFKTIMIKSANGEGCNQLLHCYQNQDSISYNLWRSALSIAAFCEDSLDAAHKISNKYEGYDPEEVEIKIANLQAKGGPHFCTTFEQENPGGCDGCIHKGKITTPISLGKTIAEAPITEKGEYLVEIPPEEEESEEPTTYTIPEYPFPFFRGVSGGVYKRADDDGEDSSPKLVYEHDLYVVKTLTDPMHGNTMSAMLRLHLPMDGVREFAIPLESLTGKDSPLKKFLARQGVVGHAAQMENLTYFIQSSIKELQVNRKAEVMRAQFGWADNDNKFILGDRELTVDSVYHSPPSESTRVIAQHLTYKGTMEKWQECFNMYNRPGLEPNAFGAFTAFGSPLLRFMGLNGAIINLIFKKSGSGKSTVLYMCNSVWGHPEKLVCIPKDTMNARMHRLGVMNNLPFTMDEITNMKAEEFSDLAYSMSQGRGKDRLQSQTNSVRENLTSWQGISLSSANASFEDKLGTLKDSPDGELMRFIEYEIGYTNAISTEEGKRIFDHQLRENYGHAGAIYAQYLLGNLEEVKADLLAVQAKLNSDLSLTQRERFWSAVIACNITGALIAKRLGLIDYDIKRVYSWVCKHIKEAQEAAKSVPLDNSSGNIGDFLNRHIRNILVINGEVDTRTKLPPAPIQEPFGELLVRFEPDTKKMFIAVRPFKEYCSKYQVDYKNLLRDLKAKGVYEGSAAKRMAAGTKLGSSIPTHAIHLNCAAGDFIDVEAYVNADRGDNVPD